MQHVGVKKIGWQGGTFAGLSILSRILNLGSFVMHTRKLFIITLLSVMVTAPILAATIVVKTVKRPGTWAFLVNEPYPGLPCVVSDSTRVGNDGTLRFSFAPDTKALYEIRVGSSKLSPLGLINTDSVVFIQASDRFRILYDLNGATVASFKFFDSKLSKSSNYGELLSDTGCLAFARFRALTLSSSHTLKILAAFFAKRYPEYVSLTTLLDQCANDYLTLEMLKYQSTQEYRLNQKGCYPSVWADTLSMVSGSRQDSMELDLPRFHRHCIS